jgi:hypothetical protein
VSESFAMLATASKSKIVDFIGSKSFCFRKVVMATSFQQKVKLIMFKERWARCIPVSEPMIFVGTGGGFGSSACESVSAIVFSPSVDSVLWRRKYPHKYIMHALRTCNLYACECPYNFEGKAPLFRLWQSLSAYLVCTRAGAQAGFKIDDGELRKATGVEDWMCVPNNRIAFRAFRVKWDEIALLVKE